MSSVAPGTKVIAIEKMDATTAWIYGEGEFLGNLEPDVPWFPQGLKNPCIQLADGKYVWGFECWWGEADKVRQRIGERDLIEVPVLESISPKRGVP